ncbi:hypothetical protein CIPAW_06G168600 [Carya illinoinensis]|uniref:Uncharacterized protein n=1 Tax=Carya illinoinensis TaxID=32201 RepID=A0A8T1QCU9_CARIL|nr:hypothetical protein CIPAW_06G168600 [Carya illinoinensis]KAG6710154.1 hypothetical protein I3842_06G169600 [Carya illinoinensis]
MAWRSRSLSRSLLTTIRSLSRRSSLPLFHLRSPPLAPSTRPDVRSPFYHSATCWLRPRLTSYLSVNVRAFCEMSHGTFRRTCQDR